MPIAFGTCQPTSNTAWKPRDAKWAMYEFQIRYNNICLNRLLLNHDLILRYEARETLLDRLVILCLHVIILWQWIVAFVKEHVQNAVEIDCPLRKIIKERTTSFPSTMCFNQTFSFLGRKERSERKFFSLPTFPPPIRNSDLHDTQVSGSRVSRFASRVSVLACFTCQRTTKDFELPWLW